MNTVLSRANSLFAFSLSVMAALTFGCFITTAFKERSVPVRIAVSRVTLKNVEDFTGPRERSDLGFSIFDWNVKQLFLYLSAEYSTKNNALNQVVLWDKIMLRGDNPRLSLKDMKSKYFFFDDGNGLKGNRNITLTLSWNVVPNAGILPLVTGSGHVSVPFPDTYETTKSHRISRRRSTRRYRPPGTRRNLHLASGPIFKANFSSGSTFERPRL
ncbi:hypothetical protein IHE44_0013094 [Lamprotornis superbus]|uniref:Signal peptidase complex subunit 3 n=1 Tax=Lamprotornis superbus TaxID=245042 RepID=A0A835P7F4_9PASS|nr:hypothetical protein IHE44_0013094 [Lamprotornis superbus]